MPKIAVLGATLKWEAGTVGVNGAKTIVSPPSTKDSVNDMGIYVDEMSILIAGAVKETCTGATGSGTLKATGENWLFDDKKVVLVGDVSESITCTGWDNTKNQGAGEACTFDVKVEIDDAGQPDVELD